MINYTTLVETLCSVGHYQVTSHNILPYDFRDSTQTTPRGLTSLDALTIPRISNKFLRFCET